MKNAINCKQAQGQWETGAVEAEARHHFDTCSTCAEYTRLVEWSGAVMQSARIEATPPLMSTVWASIHRARETAWDSALTRSFRRLVPFMVAIVAIILLLGFNRPSSAVQAAAQASTSPFVVLNAPEMPVVASVMTADSTQDPGDVLGVPHL